jgi:hypothetical protein
VTSLQIHGTVSRCRRRTAGGNLIDATARRPGGIERSWSSDISDIKIEGEAKQ